ncbi:MAG: hypothetical protein K6F17_01620 [Lachnospiraceae bacterium]|nr:hypothetical protein [Lachnospiraceae bacterium]
MRVNLNSSYMQDFKRYNEASKKNMEMLDSRMSKVKEFLRETKKSADETKKAPGQVDIAAQSMEYANRVRESRQKSSAAKTAVKKVRYSANSLSSAIIRSKTSLTAKQAASKAKREVLKLKKNLINPDYDADEVRAAIAHAESMERIAKKKASNLELEEKVEIREDARDYEEDIRSDSEYKDYEESAESEEFTETEEVAESGYEEVGYEEVGSEDVGFEDVGFVEATSADIEAMTDEVTQLLKDMSSEMLEEVYDQLEILDQVKVPRTMNEGDYKKMVAKHRSDEMKEIQKADREYLKFVFDKMSKISSSDNISRIVNQSAQSASAGAESVSMGMDVQI